jgi:hypothetical protein
MIRACLLMLFAISASAQPLRFSVKQLAADNNEGLAIGDIDGDGKADVVAGEFWYRAPEFTPHKLREIAPFGEDYLENNGDHLLDVDGDSDLDVVSGTFMPDEIYWFENPGAAGLDSDKLWTSHLLADAARNNEGTFLHDLDGDGTPEFVVNSWRPMQPMLAWKLVRGDTPKLQKITIGSIGEGANGHGMGFGDVNGDGHEDIVFANGWYEHPGGPIDAAPWTLHSDWELVRASCPMLVRDLNNDGLADIIWGSGHDYGLHWLEQQRTGKWRRHIIDDSYSQAHALHWADIDGDGQGELITGKRVRGHSGKDPGAAETPALYYYKLQPGGLFGRFDITRDGPGIGLQIRTADLNGDGRLDIAVPGKSGTHLLFNDGPRTSHPPMLGPEFESLFDGKSLNGWSGADELWRVENGIIVGETTTAGQITNNSFLVWRDGDAGDFELHVRIRVLGDNNSGIQYRSGEYAPHRIVGYQCDVHPAPVANGMAYEEGSARGMLSPRGQLMHISPSGHKNVRCRLADLSLFPIREWNTYSIIAHGHRISHLINGVSTAAVIDEQKGASRGLIAIQLHAGKPVRVEVTDIRLRRYPAR